MRKIWIFLFVIMVISQPIIAIATEDSAQSEAVQEHSHSHDHDAEAPLENPVDLENVPENRAYLEYKLSPKGKLNDLVYKEFEEELKAANNGAPLIPPLAAHEADLNDDGTYEYIVRFMEDYTTCNDIGCHHAVVSIDGDAIKRLGYFEFSEISIASEKTNGVKNLHVYNSSLNDYAPIVYVWDDKEQFYVKAESVNGS